MEYTVIKVSPDALGAAFAEAKAVFEEKGDHEVTLLFSGEEYRLDKPLHLDAAAFPGRARLRLIGGGKDKTVLSSLKTLPTNEFKAVAGKPYRVYQFAKGENGEYPCLRSLYLNGALAAISRSNEYRTTPDFTRDGVEYKCSQEIFKQTHMFYVPKAAVDEVGVDNIIGAEIHIRVEWEFKIYHVASVDLNDSWVDEDGKTHVALYINPSEENFGNGFLAMYGRVFFLCNSKGHINAPGQYAYDKSKGMLYLYADTESDNCVVEIGELTSLITLEHFASVTMENLTLTGLEDAVMTDIGYYAAMQAGFWKYAQDIGAVRINCVDEMNVVNCTFKELPCDALHMFGVLNRVSVRGCRFLNIGGTAIRMGYPRDYSIDNQINNLEIVNNYLDGIGLTYENCCSILITKARGAKVNHNTVLNSSYTAFSLGWRWAVGDWEYGTKVNLEDVEIAYNYIKSFMTNMRDGGGIYTLGGNVQVGHSVFMNTLHDNFVIEDEKTCPENGFFASLYHDGASSNWHTYNNIVIHNPALNGTTRSYSGRIYLQKVGTVSGVASTEGQAAWHILCENNFVCCCKNYGEVFRSQGFDPEKASDMLDITRDLREINTHLLDSPEELKNYPVAVRVMEACGCDESVKQG